MRLNEISFDGGLPIDGYGPGFFRVGGEVLHGAVQVLPGGARSWRGYDQTELLLAAAHQLDVLFVGTGSEIAHVPVQFRTTLEAAGLGVEVASSPAAARTYNVLLSEGRRVGVALLPVN